MQEVWYNIAHICFFIGNYFLCLLYYRWCFDGFMPNLTYIYLLLGVASHLLTIECAPLDNLRQNYS